MALLALVELLLDLVELVLRLLGELLGLVHETHGTELVTSMRSRDAPAKPDLEPRELHGSQADRNRRTSRRIAAWRRNRAPGPSARAQRDGPPRPAHRRERGRRIGDMVAALEADQGLAADLLRYANSAACARPLRARSIRAAVTLVGRKAIAQLALEAATFRFFQRAPGNGGRSIGHLHLHAAAVAARQAIAERTGADVDVAHLGGLLHDVGSSSCRSPTATTRSTRSRPSIPPAPRAAAERKLFGVDHAEAGALVARASQVEEPVELHRLPSRRPRRPRGRLARGCLRDHRRRGRRPRRAQGARLRAARPRARDARALRRGLRRPGPGGRPRRQGRRRDGGPRRRARAPGARRRPDGRAQPPPLDGHGPPRGGRPRARQRADLRHRPLQGRQRRPRPRDGRPRADRGRAPPLRARASSAGSAATSSRSGSPAARARGDEAASRPDALASAFAGDARLEVGISIGTASPGEGAETLSLVLSRADEALYEAKRAGRGRAVRY